MGGKGNPKSSDEKKEASLHSTDSDFLRRDPTRRREREIENGEFARFSTSFATTGCFANKKKQNTCEIQTSPKRRNRSHRAAYVSFFFSRLRGRNSDDPTNV